MARAKRSEAPERRCIVTRATAPTDAMIRFVLGPDGAVVPDLRARLPGRGAWVTATRASVAAAAKRGAFARSFRTDARPPADLADAVEAALLARALETLSLANKAGQVVTGFAKVEAAVRAGEAIGLVHASDAGSDGVRRLEALARGLDLRHAAIDVFTGEQLDLALGRANMVHAALKAGDLSELAIGRSRALERYRGTGEKPGRRDEPETARLRG